MHKHKAVLSSCSSYRINTITHRLDLLITGINTALVLILDGINLKGSEQDDCTDHADQNDDDRFVGHAEAFVFKL